PSSGQEERMAAIQVTARLTIHEGKLEEFKELAAQCMRSVRERIRARYSTIGSSATPTGNVVLETYKDSGALLEHIANLGATLEANLSVCDMGLEIYGSPSVELVKATAALAPKIYSPFQSL